MTYPDLSQLVWNRHPSAFELVEAGILDEEQPEFARVGAESLTRGHPAYALKNYWQSFLRRIRGYKVSRILFEQQSVWLPLFDLHVPYEGTAELTYKRSSEHKTGAEIKVLGIGFGSSLSTSITETVAFKAEKSGKSYQIKLLATAIEYVSRTDPTLIRLDLNKPEGASEYRICDIPLVKDTPDIFNTQLWTIDHHIDLTNSNDLGYYLWQKECTIQASWKVGLEAASPTVLEVGLKCGLEVEHSEDFGVKYELPYGKNYYFFHQNGETPLIPLCYLA